MHSYQTEKITHFWILLFFLVSSQCWWFSLSAQDLIEDKSPLSQNFAITQYSMEEGLPQSTVRDIIQTRDGYIWLATFGGLVRFDGNSFTTFNRSNTTGMGSDRLLKIFEDRYGGLWLFSEEANASICRFKDGACENFSLSDKPIQGSNIHEDGNGTIWIQADNKFWHYNGEELQRVEIKTGSEVLEKAINDPKGIWLGYQDDLLKTTGDELVLVEGDFSIVEDDRIIQVTKHPYEPGHLLIGTSLNGVLETDENRNIIETYPLPYNYFLVFRFDNQKNIFGLTAEGIILFHEGGFRRFSPLDTEDDILLTSILQDNEGNYWIGTEGDGLFKLRRSIISMIDKEDGLENDKMLSLTKLNDGTMLFSSNCGGVFEWKNGRATLSKLQEHFLSPCNWSVYQDSKGRIWVGGANPYVTNALDEPGKEFKKEDGYDAYTVFAMMEDSKGQMWISTSNGIFVYQDGFKKTYTMKNGLYFDHVSSLLEDSDGTVWAGTKAGVNTIRGDDVSKIALLEKPLNGEEITQPWVRAIYQDEDGVMWFGTYGHGLFSLKDGEITNITEQSGLFDNIISHIVEDENGFIWMGSNRGISRVHRDELLQFIAGDIENVHNYSYGTAEGMNSAETNGGFQPSTVTDSLGNIYFPTVEGVAVISTKDVDRNEIPPPVYIERLNTYEKEIPVTPEITLTHDNSYLEINYTALSYTAPEKVEFKYRMKGLSDSWINVGNRRTALFSKIPPGEYTFELAGSNNDGVWNNEGASLAISVIPPFWQTNWFYSLISLLLLSLGAGMYLYRVRHLERANERQKRFTEQLLESQENERRRIASDLHDGLGQQILVIKNRTELAIQQVGNAEMVNQQLSEIMQSAVSSIEDVRSISHALRPVHLEKFGLTEALNNLCDQLQDISSTEWSYHIDEIDEVIPKEKEINFYRVIQEGVKNVINHASAEEASLMVRRSGDVINTVLWDNGNGFEMKKMDKSSGLGFLGMNERIETLGGNIDIESSAGKGTVIKITIPVQKNA